MNKIKVTLCFILISVSLFSQNGKSFLKVVGRQLQDSCGETIMLRGVNHGNIWTMDFDMGMPEFTQIAMTNANCVRICLERKYESWSTGSSVISDLRGGQIDTIIQTALDQHLIPIVELHDFTSGTPEFSNVQSNLDSAVAFWTRPSVMDALKKHSHFLILNIANEPEHDVATDVQYYNACLTAVNSIRNAGLDVPIMLDAKFWGQDESCFITSNYGSSLLAADPQHNLLFSVHAYWESSWYNTTAVINRFDAIYNSGLPFVIGEFAYENGTTGTVTIDYRLIMYLCNQYQIGYLYWWWGFYDPNSNNNLSMTQTGAFTGLSGIGLEVADSIQNSSIVPFLMINGSCFTGIESNHLKPEYKLYPNPTTGNFNVVTSDDMFGTIQVSVKECTGKEVYNALLPINHGLSNFYLKINPGLYIITITNSFSKEVIYKSIVVQ